MTSSTALFWTGVLAFADIGVILADAPLWAVASLMALLVVMGLIACAAVARESGEADMREASE